MNKYVRYILCVGIFINIGLVLNFYFYSTDKLFKIEENLKSQSINSIIEDKISLDTKDDSIRYKDKVFITEQDKKNKTDDNLNIAISSNSSDKSNILEDTILSSDTITKPVIAVVEKIPVEKKIFHPLIIDALNGNNIEYSKIKNKYYYTFDVYDRRVKYVTGTFRMVNNSKYEVTISDKSAIYLSKWVSLIIPYNQKIAPGKFVVFDIRIDNIKEYIYNQWTYDIIIPIKVSEDESVNDFRMAIDLKFLE